MFQDHFCKNAFLTHFGPFSRDFGLFDGTSSVTTGSQRAKSTCLSIPSGLGINLEKMLFFALGTLVDQPLAPTVHGGSCPLAPQNDYWYGGLGVSLAVQDAWTPRRVASCGWTSCPQNSDLSLVAQHTARAWFWACLTQTVHIQATSGPFCAICGARGLERVGHFECVPGALLDQKRLFWGTKCAVLGGQLPTWRPRPGAPPVGF